MNPILFQKIEEFGINHTRISNVIQNAGVDLVGELVQLTESRLLRTKNFGRTSLNELKRLLASKGLSLGMKIDGWPVLRDTHEEVKHLRNTDYYAAKHVADKRAVEEYYAALAALQAAPLTLRCPKHHTHDVWASSTGPRCAICAELLDGTTPPVSKPLRSILNWQRLINAQAHKKGWYDDGPLNFGQQIALITSELSEALTEARHGHGMKEIYEKDGKPEGIPIEFADAVIRILDLCEENGIDLEAAMVVKHEFNEGRERKHGKRF